MNLLTIRINGKEIKAKKGQTVLQAAKEVGIEIPTLCNDERVKIYGGCGVCLVESETSPRLLRACATMAAHGQIVKTNTERIRKNRKAALELLLSNHAGDCRPPCQLACPAQTDCQGYVGLIANGEYAEAARLIRDKIPLPASIGRVCPHPCQDGCRRKLVEQPIQIAALKQFAGDLELATGVVAPELAPATGKRVAIIGGGPGGLSAAYFLAQLGHSPVIFDAMPQMGGMLRYGIPEYRLPKAILDAEIEHIQKMGVVFHNNMRIGQNLTLDYLKTRYDAVCIAIGAWSSVSLGIPGENLDGVVGSIDFLRDVALNEQVFVRQRVAVIGGGNTAMDICRTAVRLGASEVFNIYRRSRAEMPAEDIEIIEAEEERVIFKNLTNPIEIVGNDGKVSGIRLQIMELGEADESGRRSPIPIAGEEELLEVDTVVVAIGQRAAVDGLSEIALTRRGTIAACEDTFATNLPGVFAIGDATNNGADIAISAIGEAKGAAAMIDKYLRGREFNHKSEYLAKTDKTEADFTHIAPFPALRMRHRAPNERRDDFLPVNLPMGEAEVRREAARCLECGCLDYFECRLLKYANEYDAQPERFAGAISAAGARHENAHPYISYNPEKCVLCGLCVRMCDEVVGATALGLVERGFETQVAPALLAALADTDCISCGQCAAACPTGALLERMLMEKQVPLAENTNSHVCGHCSLGCKSQLKTRAQLLVRAMPFSENSLLCVNGRFGLMQIAQSDRPESPMIMGKNASYGEAMIFVNKKLQGLQARHGADAVAMAVSGRLPNEQLALIMEYAQKVLRTDNVFSFGKKGKDCPNTATMDELENTSLIIAINPAGIVEEHGVAAMKIKRAHTRGAKLVIVGDTPSILDKLAHQHIANIKDLENHKDFVQNAQNAIIIFQQNFVCDEDANWLEKFANDCGHAEKPRSGIIRLLPEANSRGLMNFGVRNAEEFIGGINSGKIKGLLIFGEDPAKTAPEADLHNLEFIAASDILLTDTAARAQAYFPASTYPETGGTFTNLDGTNQTAPAAMQCKPGRDSIWQIQELLRR